MKQDTEHSSSQENMHRDRSFARTNENLCHAIASLKFRDDENMTLGEMIEDWYFAYESMPFNDIYSQDEKASKYTEQLLLKVVETVRNFKVD